MKTTIFLSLLLVLLAACSRPCPEESQQIQESADSLREQKIADVVAVAKEDTIRKYLEMRKKEKEQYQKELAQSQLGRLELSPIPYFHQNGTRYNLGGVSHIKSLTPSVTITHWTESVLITLGTAHGSEAELVKAQLALPGVMDELLEQNEDAIDSIVTEWGMQPTLRGMAHGMMPFLEQKIPATRAVTFQAFFDKYGDSQYGIPRNNSEWKGMKEKFKLTEQELNIEYKAWLFVKRRQKDGTLGTILKAAKWAISQFK